MENALALQIGEGVGQLEHHIFSQVLVNVFVLLNELSESQFAQLLY